MEKSSALSLEQQYRKFNDLYLCDCGYARYEPLHSRGPAVRPNYLICCVLDGEGSYRAEGREYRLGKGDGFLVEPGQRVTYRAGADKPWSCLWIVFDGLGCQTCLRALGLGNGTLTFRYEDGAELLELVEQMIAHRKPDSASVFLTQALLCRFFACLAEGLSKQAESGLSAGERERLYVYQALEYIRGNYAKGITVADMAEYVGLNRSYLFTLFRRVLGVSPREYLTRFRLTRAREQLANTDVPVANIAVSCGYRDPQVFTKAFRQQFGVTPVKYRSQEREAEQR